MVPNFARPVVPLRSCGARSAWPRLRAGCRDRRLSRVPFNFLPQTQGTGVHGRRRRTAWSNGEKELMATHPHRFGPLHILNADWRRDTWKRWLRSRLAEAEPQAATATSPITSQTIAPPPPPVSERVETGVESRRTEVR